MRVSALVGILGCTALAACGSSSFTGGAAATRPSQPLPSSSPLPSIKPVSSPLPSPSPVPPAPCNQNGQTVAKLMSGAVKNGDPAAFITYELSVTDCANNPQPLTAQYVLFDVNGQYIVDPLHPNIASYELKAENGTTPLDVRGNFQTIANSDLFGNTGPTFSHYSTDQQFVIPAGTTKLLFSVNLNGLIYHTWTSANQTTTVFPAQEALVTYLRFGTAAPVSQTVIFQN